MLVKKSVTNDVNRPDHRLQRTSHPNGLIAIAASDKHVSRVIALTEELNRRAEQRLKRDGSAHAQGMIPETHGQAPFGVIKKRASRYRMPRRLKQQLINRFVSGIAADKPTVMIVAAHQDDESIGAGARLCTLSDAWVVHVTDGAPADPSVALRYGFGTREDYAEARRKELNAALDIAGVLPEHRLCLNYIDGEASLMMFDLVLRLADLVDSIRPDIIITHPYEGGHTDHDATAFAVHLACGLLRREGIKPPAVLEMTSYHRRENRRVVHEFLPHAAADKEKRELILDEQLSALKRQMYDCFATQRGVIQNFTTEIEKFRAAPRYDFTRPPHEGELNYERFGDPYRGHRWRRDAEDVLTRLRMRKSA